MIQRIGKHKVSHCDLMQLNIKEFLEGQEFDVMYSDPPWGEGNLKYWQTMNVKMNDGAERNEVDLNKFLNIIFDSASKYVKDDGVIFIEYGQRWKDQLIDIAKNYGLICNEVIEMLYRGGGKLLPLDLHIYSKKPIAISQEYIDSVYQTYGYDSLKKAIAGFAKKDNKILDLSCGMGYTAQTAVDNNMTFFGNELNLTRLGKTIKRLEKDKNK